MSVAITFDAVESVCSGFGSSTPQPLSWDDEVAFCAPQSGGGCDAPAECLPKSAASRCVLTDEPSCPQSFPADQGIYFRDVDDARTCPSCASTCVTTQPGVCPEDFLPARLVPTDDTFCTDSGNQHGTPIETSERTGCIGVSWPDINALHFEPVMGQFGGACTNDTTPSGTATPTMPTRICCQ